MHKKLIISTLILIIVIVLLLILYKSSLYSTYTGTIIRIDENQNILFVSKTPETLESANTYDESIFGGYGYENAYALFSDYIISTSNAKIKNINGNSIDISDLKVGDTVSVIYYQPKETNLSNPGELSNVKSIKVIE